MTVRRVVITGAECTGKTALVQALSRALGVPWSAEFSRDYAERAARALHASDVEPIALGQRAAEDAVVAAVVAAAHVQPSHDQPASARHATRLVLHDTDLLSTLVYARHYYGDASVPAWLPPAVVSRAPALYLLCAPDMPWERDPVRDSPEARSAVHALITQAVRASGVPVVGVSGMLAPRIEVALAAMAAL